MLQHHIALFFLHEVKVHYSRDLCLDGLDPALEVWEGPGVTIEGRLKLITHPSVEESQLQQQES